MGENPLSAFIAIRMHIRGSRDSESMHIPHFGQLRGHWVMYLAAAFTTGQSGLYVTYHDLL